MFGKIQGRYLTRLQVAADPVEVYRLEMTLAFARLALSSLALLATLLDLTEPARYGSLVQWLLSAWIAYSLLVIPLLRWRKRIGRRGVLALHLVDIFWPTLMMVFSNGPSSPLFVFFTFTLVAAAFRWGFPETMLTSVAEIGILIFQAALMNGSTRPFSELGAHEYEINRMVLRLSFLLTSGFLIGVLGEDGKERKAEGAALGRLVHEASATHKLSKNLGHLLYEICRIFGAEKAFIVAEEKNTGRVYLWRNTTPADAFSQAALLALESGTAGETLLKEWPQAFFCRRLRGKGLISVLEGGRCRQSLLPSWPFTGQMDHGVKSFLAVRCDLGREWTVQIVAINFRVFGSTERYLRFAELLLQQAAGAYYNVYLMRRIRARTGAMERARVARALHDGVIQSLISVEMRIDVLRRKAAVSSEVLCGELGETQELLRREVMSLRDLMQQLRPVDLEPAQLVDFLADTVERFRRDSGIDAHFVGGEQDEVTLTPHACRELVRILQEALVNVRKHAAAHSVLVTFSRDTDGGWHLTVHDDGKGFGFDGRVDYDGPLVTPQGPIVIKERVRALGGRLSIESHPGQGSVVEVSLARRGTVYAN